MVGGSWGCRRKGCSLHQVLTGSPNSPWSEQEGLRRRRRMWRRRRRRRPSLQPDRGAISRSVQGRCPN
eukprot:1108704-Pyramimonas_sp.AAC.1